MGLANWQCPSCAGSGRGASPDLTAKKRGMTALLLAAERGCKDVVAMLVQKAADTEARDDGGKTALMLAAERGYTLVVSQLLEARADTESRSQSGKPALTFAAWNGHKDAVTMLLDANADLNAQDSDGATPLIKAAEHGEKGAVSVLLDSSADAEVRDKRGKTALALAASRGYVDTVALLLDAGADPDAEAEDGTTALSEAKRQDNRDSEQLLLEAQTLVLTLHISPPEEGDGRLGLSVTSMRGEELAATRVEPRETVRDCVALFRRELGQLVRLVLPNGRVLAREDAARPLADFIGSAAPDKSHDATVQLML